MRTRLQLKLFQVIAKDSSKEKKLPGDLKIERCRGKSTSCEMSDWMNHKKESRWLGDISTSSVAQMVTNLPAMQETQVQSQLTPVFLPGKSHGQRSLAG